MYCIVQDVTAPIEVYDRVHAAVKDRVGDRDIGLLVHLARATADRFTVTEIWRSRADFDRAMTEILGPVLQAAGAGPGPDVVPPVSEFEPRGLIVQSAGVVV